ncbi:MAG: alpha/beta fold hydrolase [Geminicoccaceae bacterium]
MRYLTMVAAVCFAYAAHAEEPWTAIPEPEAMPDAQESGLASVNGIQMHYAVFGSGEKTPILMIHGGLAHADIWGAQVADLMSDHKVIVADTRGHGRSTHDGSTYAYDLLADDYLALLDHLEIEAVHLVGWSDGANIGYSISTKAPERLASHFAHAGNVTLEGIDPSVETDEVFGTYVGMMAADYAALSPTPDGFDGFVGAITEMWGTEKPGGVDSLKSISVPTLVVQSEHDEAILMEHSKLIAETIPGAELLVLEDVSHFASFQKPEAYTAAIRAFVD